MGYVTCYNSLPVFLITIFFIFVGLVCCDDDPQLGCDDPNWCGRTLFNLSYPFWGGNRPLSCGEEGFELDCHGGEYATLEMDDELTFRVLGIDQATCTMTLARDDLWENNCLEPQHRRNTTLNTDLFSYASKFHSLTLFYGCKHPNPLSNLITNAFKCHEDETAFFTSDINVPVIKNLPPGITCESSVQVPVLKPVENLDQLRHGLRRGFSVQYRTKNQDKKDLSLQLKLGIGFGTSIVSIAIMLVLFYMYLRRKKAKHAASLISRDISSDPSSNMVDFEKGNNNLGVHLFSYYELEQATCSFDSAKELGDGGFGTVYYGKLKDGRVVAVKRLYEHNFKRVEQFLNEVEILTRLRHKNLVSLYGCTSSHSRELLLVYEYVSNGTVADHLHGPRGKLPWHTRLKIAVETATALSYLHASEIIHRDVKTNNILLDEHFCVKVADFGLSRLFPLDVTHVSTAPQGTPGYVDPDYHQCYQLTVKSDVYSFGVVLIELISSKPAVDITRHRHEINLSNLAINKIQSKALHELVDPSIGFETDSEVRKGVEAVAELAFGCLQGDKDLRPSMKEVLEALKCVIKDKTNGDDKGIDDHGVALLKNTDSVTLSPDSVIMKWSCSTDTTATSNASL